MYFDANYFVSMNDGKSGPAFWPPDRATVLKDIIEPMVNASMFAASTRGGWYVKQHWTVPQTHTYAPHRRGVVATAHPLLLLSTTWDPICPLVSARAAHRAFAGARLVEVRGYGHCSVAVASACVARHVRAFLADGTVPAGRYTTCEVDGPYFVPPAAGGQVGAGLWRAFEDPADAKVHMAQLELARGAGWPLWARW